MGRPVNFLMECYGLHHKFIPKNGSITVKTNFFNLFCFQLQTPASFSQSIQELIIALQRSGDPGNLCQMRDQFELLSHIDASPGLCGSLFCKNGKLLHTEAHKFSLTEA